VAVVGKPDLEAGELPVAFVVLKKDHKASAKGTPLSLSTLSHCFLYLEIVEWAEKKSAPHKKLRGGVVFVDAIPKSASGKILRKLVRANL
jgi:4-coumarate--CoA ligase